MLTEEPQNFRVLDDGVVEVFRLVRVPLPNADPNTWTDATCAEAFEAIAETWDEQFFSLIAPIVAKATLTQAEFNRWIDEMNYEKPNFWGNTEKRTEQQSSDRSARSKRKKPVQYQIQKAVEALAKEKQYGGKFPPDDMPPNERNRLITEWLAGGDDFVREPSERILRDYFNRQRT